MSGVFIPRAPFSPLSPYSPDIQGTVAEEETRKGEGKGREKGRRMEKQRSRCRVPSTPWSPPLPHVDMHVRMYMYGMHTHAHHIRKDACIYLCCGHTRGFGRRPRGRIRRGREGAGPEGERWK